MADWDYIECGFNAEDETINFGTRNFAAIDNLYETSTLASIKPSEEGSKRQPYINAHIQNGSIFFAINKTMRVFKDLHCSDLSFNATFDHEIDVFCTTSDGKFLLLCLRSGAVYCFNMESSNVIYAENILENDVDEPFFVMAVADSGPSFILILRNGTVYKIKATDCVPVSDEVEGQPDTFTCDLLTNLNCSIHTAAFVNPLLIMAGKEVYAYNVETNKMYCDDIYELKRVFSFNTRMFIGLDWSGHLINICTKTFFPYPVATVTLFDDILLIHDATISRILGITKMNELGDSYLQLLSYPEYCIIFSLKMSVQIHLITPEHIHDEIIYISELKHGENVGELRFKVVSETSPENRLKRLLQRQKFDEAEQCAKLFQLDLTEIQKAKAQVIVDKTICHESDVDSLLNILNTIQDAPFQIKSCLDTHASCDSLEDVERILNYGYFLVPELNKSLCEESQDVILELMFRFNTFMALVRCGSEKNNVQDWIDFSECNLIQKLLITLEHNCIEESIIIYNRLDTTTISTLNEKHIRRVLDVLNNVPMETQLTFLNIFLPLTLSYLPSSLDFFIKWIVGKVFQIETRHPKEFPENAVTFTKKMVYLLKIESFANINFQQQCTVDQKNLQQLTDLLEALELLQLLKTNYRIVVPLQQFLQPKEIVIEELLNRIIFIVNIEHFLEEFIRKFILNNHREPDVIFTDVIKNITKYAEKYWINVVPVILNSIASVNLKLEATLIVLKTANVPWCTTIRDIANQSLQYSHRLVTEIIQEIEYEPKCVILKKGTYKLTKRYLDSIESLKHAISRMIYCNQPTMIEDIYQVCKDSEERHEGNMLLITNFIKKGEITKALGILNNNSQDEVIKCCEKLVITATFAIDNKYKMNSLQENYYQILGSVFRKLQEDSPEFEKRYLQKHLENLRSSYRIRKHFSLQTTSKDLEHHNSKRSILENLLLRVIEDFEQRNDLLACIHSCGKISTYLGIDKTLTLLKLCNLMGDFNVILRTAETIYSSNADAEALCHIATLIMKYLGSPNISLENCSQKSNEESFLQDIRNVDVNVFVRGLKLASKMIVKATLKCERDKIGNCMELANWIQTTYCITQDAKQNLPKFLSNAYGTDLIMSSDTALNAVKYFSQLYAKIIDPIPRSHLNTRYLMYVHNDTPKMHEIELTAEIQSFQSMVKYLCIEGHSFTAYKLLGTLQRGLMYNSTVSPNVKNSLTEIINWCNKQLLQNVFAARPIDAEFAYNLVLSFEPKYSVDFLFETLKLYKRDALKLKTIAQIFLRFLQHYKIEEHQRLCTTIIYFFKWWKKIKNCQITNDHFFKLLPHVLLEKLIKLNHLNIELITEFCIDFKLDVNIYYKFYLKHLLLNWKADYTIQTNINGKKQLIMKNTEDQLFQDCMEVINVIKDGESVYDMMDRIWDSINFYHYEVFICILKISSSLQPNVDNTQKKLLLLFLKDYNRVSSPGKTEEEEWYTLYPDTQSIELLSEWRLPFTPTLFTNKIWTIIRPEIDLKTYTKWFEAVSILQKNLNKDDICSFVIKNIVSSGVFHQSNSSEWVLNARHNDLLLEIDACLQNMSNLEQATSAIYHLTTNIPGGADQVNAITLCYKYAHKYQKQSPPSEDVQKAFIKVKKKYFSFSAAHILHINQLADKNYLEMVSGPVDELIEALYMDDRILNKAAFIILHCPDINKAVNELAALYNIDVQEKRLMLLNDWLSNTATKSFNLDASILMSSNFNNRNKYRHDVDSDNLIRASYLCTSGDVSAWRMQLLKFGDVKLNESKNLTYKANALKCFCNISDTETIEKLTDTTYDEFRNFINKLMLISCLECFGFSLTIESLDNYNKNELLTRLAYHITSRIGVTAMASVCITYTIYEAKYWKAIISAMLKQNVVQELKDCVNFLKKSIIFHNKKFYIDAWQAVINNSFNLKSNTNEEELKCMCVDNFSMIQSCPVLFALDFEHVIKKCMELKKYDFAALATQYLTKEQQIIYRKQIFNADQDILKKIDELAHYGFWGISFIKRLLIEREQVSSAA